MEADVEQPSHILASLIAYEFNVSRDWLLHGTGDMHFADANRSQQLKDENVQSLHSEADNLLELLSKAELTTSSNAVYGVLEEIKKVFTMCRSDPTLCDPILTSYVRIISSVMMLLMELERILSLEPSREGLQELHRISESAQSNITSFVNELSAVREKELILKAKNKQQ